MVVDVNFVRWVYFAHLEPGQPKYEGTSMSVSLRTFSGHVSDTTVWEHQVRVRDKTT